MTGLELNCMASRFRLAQSCVGLVGCASVGWAVWTPYWLEDRGLWAAGNETSPDADSPGGAIEEAESVFAALSFIMALSSGVLCLIFAFCWTSQTVRSYSNTRSLLIAGQALYPTTLLLLTLTPTGLFFLLSWSLFTHQHWGEISADVGQLGCSYWLGAVGWALLLGVVPVVFLVEQCVVPEPLQELAKNAETWWSVVPPIYGGVRSFSESTSHTDKGFARGQKRYMSLP